MKILFLALPILLAGCAKEPATLADAAAVAGCTVTKTDASANIFNGSSAWCKEGGMVYFFPTAEANDGHMKICKGFGGKPVQSGKTWTKYSPSC